MANMRSTVRQCDKKLIDKKDRGWIWDFLAKQPRPLVLGGEEEDAQMIDTMNEISLRRGRLNDAGRRTPRPPDSLKALDRSLEHVSICVVRRPVRAAR